MLVANWIRYPVTTLAKWNIDGCKQYCIISKEWMISGGVKYFFSPVLQTLYFQISVEFGTQFNFTITFFTGCRIDLWPSIRYRSFMNYDTKWPSHKCLCSCLCQMGHQHQPMKQKEAKTYIDNYFQYVFLLALGLIFFKNFC